MRQLALLLTGLAILAAINFTVWRYEAAMTSGEVVLLRLAPVDPRSLMQGDYMRLNYDIARQLGASRYSERINGSDTLVIQLDEHQVANWVADGKPEQLASNERLLQVRQSDNQWLIGPDAFFFEEGIGPDAFFFEEGTGEQFEVARYGEFRLQGNGKALLVGLRDEQFKPVGNPRARW